MIMNSVRVESRGASLWIRLNRPDVLNAFDDEMGAAFLDALGQATEPDVRAVVIIGEGRAFSAGEDLRALQSIYDGGSAPDHREILLSRYNPAVEAIVGLQKPVVAAINGVAAGAGVSIALACDYRIMAEGSSLVLAFAKVGLVPDSGATWMLPRYLGVGKAIEIALSGDPIPAARALELGLVNRVVAQEIIEKAAEELAFELAHGPTLAFGLIKKLVWDSGHVALPEQLSNEADAQAAAGKSADHLEGVKAFGEKRAPQFKGR